ncbi:MAG TPA: 6-phosphogluconolactonase [Burkholderiales bacterium]|nr:6-phosphogluconolactonase [Burkholderiales bacterium]
MNLNVYATQKQQIDALSQAIFDYIMQTLKTKSQIVIAVSGGKSPIPLFTKLSNLELPWEKITITLVDERVVAPEDLDSNENLVRTYLLQSNAQKAKFIGIISDINDAKKCLDNINNNIKTIDLAILGMGEDGHTASIFPNMPELDEALHTKNKYLITNPISAKYQRITLSLNGLVNISRLFLSITNEIKLNVFKESILSTNLSYPISYLLDKRDDISVYWH